MRGLHGRRERRLVEEVLPRDAHDQHEYSQSSVCLVRGTANPNHACGNRVARPPVDRKVAPYVSYAATLYLSWARKGVCEMDPETV